MVSSPSLTRSQTTLRLTALWGLAESGLGGVMHALKLPFTGLFVGGLAMVVIAMIAAQHKNPLRPVLQSTALVLLIKFTVSPHSPMPAYIAVAFQGVTGAILFQFLPFRAAALLLLILGMLESGLQGVLLATLIYGDNLWKALDTFFIKLTTTLHIHIETSFSYWFILIYSGIYLVWGLVLGIWTATLPERLARKRTSILQSVPQDAGGEIVPAKRSSSLLYRLLPIATLLFIFLVLWSMGEQKTALYVLLRSAAVVCALLFIVQPLLMRLLKLWWGRMGSGQRLQEVMAIMPGVRAQVGPALDYARQFTGLRRYSELLTALMILTIHSNRE